MVINEFKIDLTSGVILVDKQNNSGYSVTMLNLAIRESEKQDVILVSKFYKSPSTFGDATKVNNLETLEDLLSNTKPSIVIFEDDLTASFEKARIRTLVDIYRDCTFIVPKNVLESPSGKVAFSRLYSINVEDNKSYWSYCNGEELVKYQLPLDDYFKTVRAVLRTK